MRKLLGLFQAMVAPWLLLWRLLLHRLGVWPVMFPAESALDRRMERLLLIWRYARKRSLRELRASQWRSIQAGHVWVLEVPHHLGTIWNDRDLRHVRQISSHCPRSNSRASTALAVTVPAAPPKTVPTQPRTPLIDSPSHPVGTAAEQEAARQILKKYDLPDSEGIEIVSVPRDDRKLCPKCHHPMSKDASVCYHCQRNEGHPRTRTR